MITIQRSILDSKPKILYSRDFTVANAIDIVLCEKTVEKINCLQRRHCLDDKETWSTYLSNRDNFDLVGNALKT